MPKFPKQKLRLLYIMKLLQEHSDEQHAVTQMEIADYLKQYAITFDRKSVYSDIDSLRQAGMAVVLTKGKRFGYYWANRPFALAELRLLLVAVRSASFLPALQRNQLTAKLVCLASSHEQSDLDQPVFRSAESPADRPDSAPPR